MWRIPLVKPRNPTQARRTPARPTTAVATPTTPVAAKRPYLIGVLSDMHISIIHRPTLEALEEWCADVRPDELLLNGDTFDFSVLSPYPKGENTLACAIEEVRAGVKIINRLHQFTNRIIIQYGNHCKRWEKTVIGANALALKGAKGLTLKDQCAAQGLDPRVEWSKESAKNPGVWLTKDLIARHGDLQAGRFGGAVNLCLNRLNKNNGISELVGHHHRAQLAYRTALGRTSFVMALPTMANFEDYAPGTDWQQGWATISVNRIPDNHRTNDHPLVVQPSLVLVQHGVAMWGGKLYGRYRP